MEIALIAFDALDPEVIYDNLDELPSFKALIEESMHGKWQTPGHTIPSFTATLTGREYEVCNFHWDEGRGEYQRHRQTGFDYLWDVVDSSMTLMNMPVLYPPEEIEDAMVCGFLTPDSQTKSNLARPIEVQEMLNDIGYIHDVPADRTYEEIGGDEMVELMKKMMDTKVEAASRLIDRYDSDLFYGAWTATDRWFHQAKMHDEDYFPLYKKADEVLGEMMEIVPSDVPLIVFSDHGFAHKEGNPGVHKGHEFEGFYLVNHDDVVPCKDNTSNILDLFPTVVNYLEGDVPDYCRGRTLFSSESEVDEVRSRLEELGYLE